MGNALLWAGIAVGGFWFLTRQTPNQAAGDGIAPPLFGADYPDNGAGGYPAMVGQPSGGAVTQPTLQPSPYPGGVSTSSGGVPRDGSSPPWSPRSTPSLPVNQGPGVPQSATPTSTPGGYQYPGSGPPPTLPPSGRIVVHSAPNQEPGGDSGPVYTTSPSTYLPPDTIGVGPRSNRVSQPMPVAPTPRRVQTSVIRPARGPLGDPS